MAPLRLSANGEADELFYRIEADGHFVGHAWSVASDEPVFSRVQTFDWVMEGNQEIRVDGADEPRHEYLGTEEAFGFSWGFQRQFLGTRNGINFVQRVHPTLLSLYRFRLETPIRFARGFELRTTSRHEGKGQARAFFPPREGRGWVDYATTLYWYQRECGHDHEPLPPLETRVLPVRARTNARRRAPSGDLPR